MLTINRCRLMYILALPLKSSRSKDNLAAVTMPAATFHNFLN